MPERVQAVLDANSWHTSGGISAGMFSFACITLTSSTYCGCQSTALCSRRGFENRTKAFRTQLHKLSPFSPFSLPLLCTTTAADGVCSLLLRGHRACFGNSPEPADGSRPRRAGPCAASKLTDGFCFGRVCFCAFESRSATSLRDRDGGATAADGMLVPLLLEAERLLVVVMMVLSLLMKVLPLKVVLVAVLKLLLLLMAVAVVVVVAVAVAVLPLRGAWAI